MVKLVYSIAIIIHTIYTIMNGQAKGVFLKAFAGHS
jgi:hypothetical protein